ncbi:MAG: RNA pseudouridine synthase [Parachlamydiales bacterium]|nr:RNA pseudouridine synthase [Parachlamydiales bacterium]
MKLLDKEKPIEVLYLDNHLLVVDKPGNLLTQPDDTNADNLQDRAKIYIKHKFEKKQNVFLHPIHRLDKQVSGIVIFARTSKALSRLNEQLRQKKLTKKYLAVVEGILDVKKGILKNYILHLSHIAKIVNKEQKDAKIAQLEYQVIKENQNSSLLEVDLITGRYHQIRAQLSYMGHPIVGDKKYNSSKDLKEIKLQCYEVTFDHPVTKQTLSIKVKNKISI